MNDLYENGLLDSITYPIEGIQRKIYLVNGYADDKQFAVIDANNNHSFKDDQVFYYDKDFKVRLGKNVLLRDSIPFTTITYNDFDGKGISKKQLKIKLLPVKIPYKELFPEGIPKEITESQITDIFDIMVFRQKDWRGILNIEQQKYVVNTTELFRQPEIAFYKQGHHVANQGYYKLKDSVKLGNSYYVIDSITPIWDTLFIRKLDIKAPKWGYLKGEKSVDFTFQNIDGQEKKISDLLKDKEYVLIDFWGTWCGPCKELTPDLVRMSKEYDDKLSLLSVAYDKKKEPLSKYIAKHKMEWEHVFVKGNAKSGTEKKPTLVKNFAIEAYPTFILINRELEIVYRDTGRPGLEKIEKIINNHQ